jgi:hypothetical protein
MTVPTAGETTLLRTQPQRTKLWLSVYQPLTTLACRVNDGSITKGEREITYDTVSNGTFTNVSSGMTMYVGTTLGGDEKGRIRVRSATSTVITVAENSHIDWENNDYLTIVNFFEINPVYPRIVQDASDPFDLIFYKDYDIAYSDQNTNLGTLINMGGNLAGFVNEPVYFTAEGTENLNGEGLNYQWNLGGSDTPSFTGQIPGLINYSSPGHFLVGLEVSGSSSGVIDQSWRHISIYNRPEDGSNNPILSWELTDFSGSRKDGGYTVTVKIFQSVPENIIRDGSLIVIFSDDWYGGTKQSIGGNGINRSKIVFSGYVVSGSISYNWRESEIEFDVVSPTKIMGSAEGFSISLESVSNVNTEVQNNEDIPNGWVVLEDLTPKKAIFHYLKWHSTVLKTQDVKFLGYGFNDPVQFFDSDRESLFDAVDSFVSSGLLGSTVADRQGNIYLESPGWSQQETGTFNTGYHITNKDWMGEPKIDETLTEDLSFIEMGGISYQGPSTNISLAHLASSPGNAPGYRGGLERIQGLVLRDQTHLNLLAGDLLAFRNRDFQTILFSLVGNFRNYDIAPQEFIPFTIDSGDTVRGIEFVQKLFLLEQISYQYSSRNEFLSSTLLLLEKTIGVEGDTIDIPDIPPTEGGDNSGGGGFDIDPITIPPIPPPPNFGIGVDAGYYRFLSVPAGGGIVTWDIDSNIGLDQLNLGEPFSTFTLSAGTYLIAVNVLFVNGGATADYESGFNLFQDDGGAFLTNPLAMRTDSKTLVFGDGIAVSGTAIVVAGGSRPTSSFYITAIATGYGGANLGYTGRLAIIKLNSTTVTNE